MTEITRSVSEELESVKRFNDVQRAHIGNVVQSTEEAGAYIITHINDLLDFIRVDSPAGDQQKIERTLHDLVDLLGVMQSQDIWRQQLIQVSDALDVLDGHFAELANLLELPLDTAQLELVRLTDKLNALYDRYVTQEQRITHARLTGSHEEAETDGGLSIQLF